MLDLLGSFRIHPHIHCTLSLILNAESSESLYHRLPLGMSRKCRYGVDDHLTWKHPCHAPIPGSTRLANPNRFRGAKPYTGTPYIYIYIIFFFLVELISVVYKQFL